MLINHWHHIWEVHWGLIFSEMAHLFQTQWAICPNGFDFWAEPCENHVTYFVQKPREVNPIKLNFSMTNKCFDNTQT